MARAVVYEVDLEIDPAIAAEFDAWLSEHVSEMLRLPGFETAELLVPDDAASTRRLVRYRLRDRAALDAYLAEHAARMRQQGLDRFGEKLRASRSVAEIDRALDVEGAPLERCRNCGAGLTGQYCAVCGQRARLRLITLWEFFRDLIGDLFELDSRLWRTLRPLLFRPGKLTAEYLAGRRVAYVPPLRLYLGLSIIFFLLTSFADTDAIVDIQTDPAGKLDGIELRIPDETADGPAGDTATGEGREPATPSDEEDLKISSPEDCAENLEFAASEPQVHARLMRACERIVADHGESLGRALLGNVPTMMFFFMPLLALIMKPLYLFSRRYYVEHLLFLVHYHAFAFLVLTIANLVVDLSALAPALKPVAVVLWTITAIYIPIYLYKAMRRVYGQGRILTAVKFIALGIGYLFTLLLSFVGILAYTALTL